MSMGGLPQQKWLQAALYAGLLLLFAVAVAVGMTTPMPEDELALEQARIYIGNYLETLPAARISGFKETLSDVLLNGLLLLLLALGGTHILGAPLILTVLFIKGMSVGYGAAFLLLYPGLSGGGLILPALHVQFAAHLGTLGLLHQVVQGLLAGAGVLCHVLQKLDRLVHFAHPPSVFRGRAVYYGRIPLPQAWQFTGWEM